jgi:sulfatase modifying factor 1
MLKMKGKIKQEKLPDGFTFEMIEVQGGVFTMGSEEDGETAHKVKLSSFFIGKYPVTQGLWKAVMGEGNDPSYWKGEKRPVETVSWEDAQAFCEKLRKLSGKNYRLPTEAEWEYAARGGQLTKNYTYAGSNKLKEVGWYRENSYGETHQVGEKYPNELGIYDMSGNVWEWCQDWYGDYDKQAGNIIQRTFFKQPVITDPKGPKTGKYRVVRGGSWFGNPRFCRCADRGLVNPRGSNPGLGFRLGLSLQ